jgi:transposase
MSERDLVRLGVIRRVIERELTSTEAGELLCLSGRQVKRLIRKFREMGAKGLVHASYGRASNHARDRKERDRVIGLIRERYGGRAEMGAGQRFGPTLVSEQLAEDEGLEIPVSTLRDWMRAEGLWSRRRKRKPHRRRRDRKSHFGELIQVDGSFHDWLEGRGPIGCMMTMTDDATGIMLARLGAQETFWDAVTLLREWIAKYGVPRALYTDWKSAYRSWVPDRPIDSSQFGRICSKLGIELIPASSPQAKGRVERSHGTNQDRLVKKLRLKGISTYEGVNEYLESNYLPAHNARFARRPQSSTDYHLPLLKSLDNADTWCHEEKRRVSLDGVVSYRSRLISLTLRRDMPPKAQVLVRSTEGGDLRVIYATRAGSEYELTWTDYIAPERIIVEPQRDRTRRAEVYRPPANHPWRLRGDMEAAMALSERQQTEPPRG